ncbi:MAG TPA: 4-hydroxy-tetrahydrodipicolinate reductase [Pseudomonadota bacterium]|nr:4-hydroxy-tetrahydrodipicolinate reductase [Xanthomonadales bacterium]HQW80957.1 4-hydroxy-tetrahydrodipicolinate reductase [Pseudomonadota bacterium]
MNRATPVILFGASGRMGQELLALVPQRRDIDLVAALVRPGSRWVGEPVWPDRAAALTYGSTLEPELPAEVLIDFSNAASFDAALALAVQREMAFVSGTTGLSDMQAAELDAAAARIPVLWSANFSIGVALLRHMAVEAARVLGDDFDVEIIDAHHRHKRDAPSGTALALGQAVATARGHTLEEVGVFARHGQMAERARGEIGFATVRGGDIVGDHTILFAGEGERLEFTHRASTRAVFARGALLAARWMAGRSAGRYSLDQAIDAALQKIE